MQQSIHMVQFVVRVEPDTVHELLHRLNAVHRLYKSGGIQSEKLMTLKNHLINKRKWNGVCFRCIVFVKQRISAYVLAQHLNNDKGCVEHGIRAD